MPRVDSAFKDLVYISVSQVPEGSVSTYGYIALLSGAAWAAWEVGQIAHTGPDNLPWHRVVNKKGGLARGYPGGQIAQKVALESDGVEVSDDYFVDMSRYLWEKK